MIVFMTELDFYFSDFCRIIKRRLIHLTYGAKVLGQGRIRYQIGLSPLFQLHQAQLYIERKRLFM